jgi:hypothetical protein
VDTDVIGIDQGPILIMIENYLNGRPWQRVMSHPGIQLGLARADFQPFVLGVEPPPRVTGVELGRVTPDPLSSQSRVTFRLSRDGAVTLDLIDLQGRALRQLASGATPAGEHSLAVRRDGLPAGIYWLRLRAAGSERHTRFVVLP